MGGDSNLKIRATPIEFSMKSQFFLLCRSETMPNGELNPGRQVVVRHTRIHGVSAYKHRSVQTVVPALPRSLSFCGKHRLLVSRREVHVGT